MKNSKKKITAREIAIELEREMGCNCDLDNWEPEKQTGHSCACRIHKRTMALMMGHNSFQGKL